MGEEVALLRGGVEDAGRELREAAKELQLLRTSKGDQHQHHQQQPQQQQLEAVLEGVGMREREVLRALEEGAGKAEAHGAALLEVAEGLRRREDGIRDAVELRLQETAAALRGLQVQQPLHPCLCSPCAPSAADDAVARLVAAAVVVPSSAPLLPGTLFLLVLFLLPQFLLLPPSAPGTSSSFSLSCPSFLSAFCSSPLGILLLQ